MSVIDDVRRSCQDILLPELGEIKVGLSGVKESMKEGFQSMRADMTGMERRLEEKIQAARTEILLRMELSEKAVQLAEKDRMIEELKRDRPH